MVEPWNFDGTGHFIVLYGSDLALALSLSRSGVFYDEEELTEELLYNPNLFESTRIRSLVSPKTAQRLIKMNERLIFQRSCILVVDGSIVPHGSGVFVKCNPLTATTAKLFVGYHCRLLNKPIPKNSQIKNLDQLKLVLDGYEIYQEHNLFSIWGSIRLAQMRMPEVKSIYQHLELWARDNIPNDECLKMVYFKVKKELENYRD